jgi:hypothetical protein
MLVLFAGCSFRLTFLDAEGSGAHKGGSRFTRTARVCFNNALGSAKKGKTRMSRTAYSLQRSSIAEPGEQFA